MSSDEGDVGALSGRNLVKRGYSLPVLDQKYGNSEMI